MKRYTFKKGQKKFVIPIGARVKVIQSTCFADRLLIGREGIVVEYEDHFVTTITRVKLRLDAKNGIVQHTIVFPWQTKTLFPWQTELATEADHKEMK